MTALTADLTLTGEIVLLDGPPVVGEFYHLDDEVIMVSGSVTENYSDAALHNRWRVRRAQDHTTAATHSSGAALTVAREFEAGGAGAGGVTVDNQTDPPAEVTTLIAPGATIVGDEATLPVSVYRTDVVLTNAQIKDLPLTPVVILPSPGADVLIAPFSIWVTLDTPVAYTNVDVACQLMFRGNTDGIDMSRYSEADDGFLSGGTAVPSVVHFGVYMPVVGGEVTAYFVAKAGNLIEFQATPQVAFTGGDAANTITVTVLYTTVTL